MPGDRKTPAPPAGEWGDVYGFLEQVRLRPGMFVRHGSVQDLCTMLFGYSVALQVHSVQERFDWQPALGPFADWLGTTRGWSMSRGWATAIEENAGDCAPLEMFFRLLDEYRATSTEPGRAGPRPPSPGLRPQPPSRAP